MRNLKNANADLKKYYLSDGVNRTGPAVKRAPCGTGWIVLNTQVKDYEQVCLETNTVSLLTSEHELIIKCVITKSALSDIVFPKSTGELGSLVAWINDSVSTTPIIVGVINKTTEKNTLQKSNAFQLVRGDGDNGVLIEGYGDDGTINIIARGIGGGEINIRAFNEKLLALVEMYVQGRIDIEAEDRITIKTDYEFTVNLNGVDPQTGEARKAVLSYLMNEGFIFGDEFGHQIATTKKDVQIKVNQNDTITLAGDQNDVEQSLLGESTVSALNDIYDVLNKLASTLQTLTVITSTGVINPTISSSMTDLLTTLSKQQAVLDNLKSKNIKNS